MIKPLTWFRYRKIIALMRKKTAKEVALLMGMGVKALYKTVERCEKEKRRKNPRAYPNERRGKNRNVEICRISDDEEKMIPM